MICSVRRSQKNSRETLGGKKERQKPPNPKWPARPDCGRDSVMLSLNTTNPYKGEKHYQCQAQPVGNACAIRMHPPSFVPGGVCIYTHRKSMFHGTYSCGDFLLRGAGIYMSRETSTWGQVRPLGSTQCKLPPELKERK